MCLKTEFRNYLISKGLSAASILKYTEQVPAFFEKILNKSLYDFYSIAKLEKAIQLIKNNATFIHTNKKGNNMYSSGINHYISFIQQNHILLFNNAVSSALKDTHEIRLLRLQKRNRGTKKIISNITIYDRNPDVVAERLYIANGYCEDCKQKAPFFRKSDGTPYLEVHHIIPLSQGGKDCLENTVALCPNCHRKRHLG